MSDVSSVDFIIVFYFIFTHLAWSLQIVFLLCDFAWFVFCCFTRLVVPGLFAKSRAGLPWTVCILVYFSFIFSLNTIIISRGLLMKLMILVMLVKVVRWVYRSHWWSFVRLHTLLAGFSRCNIAPPTSENSVIRALDNMCTMHSLLMQDKKIV